MVGSIVGQNWCRARMLTHNPLFVNIILVCESGDTAGNNNAKRRGATRTPRRFAALGALLARYPCCARRIYRIRPLVPNERPSDKGSALNLKKPRLDRQ